MSDPTHLLGGVLSTFYGTALEQHFISFILVPKTCRRTTAFSTDPQRRLSGAILQKAGLTLF